MYSRFLICESPVVVRRSDCRSYFEKLNPLIAFLDPELHTPTYCRVKSIHLFTAILTVACKSIRPNAYPQCLAVANLFISHAFMQGLSSIELVQSLAILAVWRESDDNNQWRRIGYAIRCALELRLHKPHPRPLPVDPEAARLIVVRPRRNLFPISDMGRTRNEHGFVSWFRGLHAADTESAQI